MNTSLKRVIIYGILMLLAITIGFIIYSSNKSANEVPKRAKLVKMLDEYRKVG